MGKSAYIQFAVKKGGTPERHLKSEGWPPGRWKALVALPANHGYRVGVNTHLHSQGTDQSGAEGKMDGTEISAYACKFTLPLMNPATEKHLRGMIDLVNADLKRIDKSRAAAEAEYYRLEKQWEDRKKILLSLVKKLMTMEAFIGQITVTFDTAKQTLKISGGALKQGHAQFRNAVQKIRKLSKKNQFTRQEATQHWLDMQKAMDIKAGIKAELAGLKSDYAYFHNAWPK